MHLHPWNTLLPRYATRAGSCSCNTKADSTSLVATLKEELGTAMNSRFLLVALLLRISRADWVEIPQVKPSPPLTQGVSISTTIKPATIDGHVLSHSHLLLSHLSGDRRRVGSHWLPSVAGGSGSSSSTSSYIRWHRPVNDLLENHGLNMSESRRVPAWVGTTTWQEAHQHPSFTLVNISNKVEQLHDAESDEDSHGDGQYPVVHTELLPFGNRYEEESIESIAANGAPKAILHYVAPSVAHFDDFDDYDEILPQVHQVKPKPPNSEIEDEEEEEYVEEEDLEEVHEPDRTIEEFETVEQAKLPSNLHVHPQPPTGLGGFLDFLRRMQVSFVQRTAHTIGDKIRMLAGMRDQLLSTIERRIAVLWRGNNDMYQSEQRSRVKRGWMEPHADTEAMDFPSAEGALLTISFLTFAVFLIKLVLQVINTIKAKHYTYSTFAAATPVSGGILVKRTRRQTVEPHELQVILGALNGFRPT
ncbi:uncharacterized protein LOC3289815 [Anopheles gambiae]|uniref:uncharacterized protein LOC3289815 n=1 Tax=Anopheles gambiae TaxID=7165 RepID=UPI002AC999CE|nr:uncharacterized protein LOC3289815 [Anopheles gambiae]